MSAAATLREEVRDQAVPREAAHRPARLLGPIAHVSEGRRLARSRLALHRQKPVRASEDVARDPELILTEATSSFGRGESWTPAAATLHCLEKGALGVASASEPTCGDLTFHLVRALREVLQVLLVEASDARDALETPQAAQ